VHNASEQRRAKRINQQIDALRDLLSVGQRQQLHFIARLLKQRCMQETGMEFKKDKGSVLETAVQFIQQTLGTILTAR